jgi:6-pyruvoyl tetrahydropterin synthase-like protein
MPIPNTTVEMLAQYFVGRVKTELGAHAARLSSIEIEVEESIGQSAFYRERF